MSGRDHSIECPRCGLSYGGLNGPDECDCKPGDPMTTPDRDAVVRELHERLCSCNLARNAHALSFCNMYRAVQRAYAAGQAHERAAVVGWLMAYGQRWLDEEVRTVKGTMTVVASQIERAAHHTKREGK